MRSKDAQTAERYRLMSLKKFQEVLRLTAKADLTSDRRVGGSLETLETITFYAETLADAFIAIGQREVVAQTIRDVGLAERLDGPNEGALDGWKELFETLKTKSQDTEKE